MVESIEIYRGPKSVILLEKGSLQEGKAKRGFLRNEFPTDVCVCYVLVVPIHLKLPLQICLVVFHTVESG